MRLLCLNYHYLKYPRKAFLKNSGVKLADFHSHLKQLKKFYTPTTFSKLNAPANKSGKQVIVTFDDGSKDCLAAANVARQLRFPLTFFVPGLPVVEHKLLAIQKIHLLMEKIPIQELARRFYLELGKIKKSFKRASLQKLGIVTAYRYDKGAVKDFKLDLNYRLPYPIRDRVLDRVFKKYYPDESRLARRIYLDPADLAKLSGQGFEIGGHSYSHLILSRLNAEQQKKEIEKSREFLKSITSPPWPFSIPFGQTGTYNELTKTLLKKTGFSHLVTMGRRINTKNEAFRVDRFDVNDVFVNNRLKKEFI